MDVSADSVGAIEDAFLVTRLSTIFRSLTVYGPMIPLSTAVLSSKSPSSVARDVLKKSAKETITLPLLKKRKTLTTIPDLLQGKMNEIAFTNLKAVTLTISKLVLFW